MQCCAVGEGGVGWCIVVLEEGREGGRKRGEEGSVVVVVGEGGYIRACLHWLVGETVPSWDRHLFLGFTLFTGGKFGGGGNDGGLEI